MINIPLFQKAKPLSSQTAARERLHIEQMIGTTIIGWASSSEVAPIEKISLLINGSPTDTRIERMSRRDVCDALRAPIDLDFGFRLILPLSLWTVQEAHSCEEVHIKAGEALYAISIPATLSELIDEIDAESEHPEFKQATKTLLCDLHEASDETFESIRSSEKIQTLAKRISWRGKILGDEFKFQGVLESNDYLVWSGWIYSTDRCNERLRLIVNGNSLDVASIRTERVDVAQAMESSRLQLGFELEVPGHIWEHSDEAGLVEIQLWSGDHNLTLPPITWSLNYLIERLNQIYMDISSSLKREQRDRLNAHEQFEVLLALEHLVPTHQKIKLSENCLTWYLEQAEIFGVRKYISGAFFKTQLKSIGLDTDVSTLELWSIQREYNSALLEDASNSLDQLRRILDNGQLSARTKQRFVTDIIPYFCRNGMYSELRPFLDKNYLRTLIKYSNASSLSLLIPECVCNSDFSTAQSLLHRINTSSTGWINTECIAEALRQLLANWPSDPEGHEGAVSFVETCIHYVQGLSTSYWGRSHDLQVVDGAVSILLIIPRTSRIAYSALTTIITLYEFNPSFWETLICRCPQKSNWPSELQFSHTRFLSYQDALINPSRSIALQLPLLSSAAGSWGLDAWISLRDIVMHQAAQEGMNEYRQALLSSLSFYSPNDSLRLAAHPLSEPGWTSDPAALADLIRRVSGVNHLGLSHIKTSAFRQLWEINSKGVNFPVSDIHILNTEQHGALGVILAVLFLTAPTPTAGSRCPIGVPDVRDLWIGSFRSSEAKDKIPGPALLHSWSLLRRQLKMSNTNVHLRRLLQEMSLLCTQRYGVALSSVIDSPFERQNKIEMPDALRSTVVAIYSCQKNLSSRVELIKQTWIKDLDKRGISWLIVVGNGSGELSDNVLYLEAPDSYEALPLKSLALIKWIHDNTDFTHLIKIDDDCHFAVDAFFDSSPHLIQHYLGRRLNRAVGAMDRAWHQSKSTKDVARQGFDKTPEPSSYADGGCGYCLSRFAMHSVLEALETMDGARITRSAYMEDKLIGDLLSLRGITVSNVGYEVLLRRKFGDDPVRVNAWQNTFYSSRATPTFLSHLDDSEAIPAVHARVDGDQLLPARIWPSYESPRLDGDLGCNQLELLSPPSQVTRLASAKVIVVAVARNEISFLPHFLTHYRKMGISHFIFIDNMSDDGTRSFLLSQPDVVVYSADTEYKNSHYGVAWQQAVLSAHALGKWVIVADVDELLIYKDCEQKSTLDWLSEIERRGSNSVTTLMIDMYPRRELSECDLDKVSPFEGAPHFDAKPLIKWKLGSGCFSNGLTWLSGLRHRLIADSAPNLYTSQKVAIFKYFPWLRLSEGLHYVSNTKGDSEAAYFAHFKYHSRFQSKVTEEVSRKQHFDDAAEYQKYLTLIAESSQVFFDDSSLTFRTSLDFVNALASPNQELSSGK